MDSGNDCATMSTYLMPLKCTLKMVNFMCVFPFFLLKGESTSFLTFQILAHMCPCSSNIFIYITLSYIAIACLKCFTKAVIISLANLHIICVYHND